MNILKEIIICQEDCEFSAYNSQIKKAKCECLAKESNSSFADMIINKAKLFDNLKDIRNLMNLNILICYKKLLLSFSSIRNNVGCLIIICIISLHIIGIFIFYFSQLKKIKKMIKRITIERKNNNIIKMVNKKINISIKNKRNSKNDKSNSVINSKLMISKKSNDNIIMYNNNYNNNINNNIVNYNNEELNELSYNIAVLYDKRTFCQFYSSLLKLKHNFIFTFFNKKDYNPGIIKIDLLSKSNKF